MEGRKVGSGERFGFVAAGDRRRRRVVGLIEHAEQDGRRGATESVNLYGRGLTSVTATRFLYRSGHEAHVELANEGRDDGVPEELLEDDEKMRLRVSDEQVSARAVPANPGLVLLVLKEVAQLADEWLQVGAELVNSLGRRIKLQLSTHGHLLDLLDLFGFFVLVCWHRRRYREVQSLRVRPRRAPRRNRWCGGCTLRWRRQWEFGIRREQKRRPIRLLYVAETSLERMDRILAWTR